MNRSQKNKRALVTEGGGMRGVFSAGVLDAFGAEKFDPFDLYIGVSAGACNLASHLAGQYGRNIHIIRNYSITSRFISLPRFITGGHYMDIDWLWESTIRDCRLDLKKIFTTLSKNKKEYFVVATSVDDGGPFYLKPVEENLEHYIKVSSSLPFIYRSLLNTECGYALDGGISDPIPVIEAYNRGASEITVIRSKHSGYIKKDNIPEFLYSILFKKYPAIAGAMKRRVEVDNNAISFIKNPPGNVTINEISPSIELQIGRTTKNLKYLNEAYSEGFNTGINFINKINNDSRRISHGHQ